MSDSSWVLAIVASAAPAGAIRFQGRTISLGTGELPDIIAEATSKTPPIEPEEIVLVHPKPMGVDEVAEWFARLNELGVRAGRVRTIADTEVLATARYGEGDGRDVIVGDALTGAAYGRRGQFSGGGTPLSVAMTQMVADAGVMTTTAVLLGPDSAVSRQAALFDGTQIRPVGCSNEALAFGALNPERLGDALGGRVAKPGKGGGAAGQAWGRKALKAVPVAVIAAIVLTAFMVFRGPDRVDGVADGARNAVNDAAERAIGPGARPVPTPTPAAAPPPEAVPQGVDVREAIAYYFDLIDPMPLLQALPNCNDDEARKYENVSFYCTGRGSHLNEFAAANGLPELAQPDAHVSVHFDTRSTRPTRGTYDHQCFIDYEYLRDDIIDGAAVEVNEPCDPDDERYAGPWPEDEDADIWIHDVRRVYAEGGEEYHPVLRVYGLKDLAAIEALLNHYGLVR